MLDAKTLVHCQLAARQKIRPVHTTDKADKSNESYLRRGISLLLEVPVGRQGTKDGERKNALAFEKSPYLLQHAENPVDWYPWGREAFDKARHEDKPIFLSIGYSTCHWCHVMAHESFEDPEIARMMNDAFVNVKVDREERPDIDDVYMEVCQAMTGLRGWPLSIVMTPDARPFFAATYIPKETRFGRTGMRELIPRIKETWRQKRPEIDSSAAEIVSTLRASSPPALGRGYQRVSDSDSVRRAHLPL